MEEMDEPSSLRKNSSPKVLFLSKTTDEEKAGGPYKWAKELEESLKEKEYPVEKFRSNWKSLFNRKIFSGFKKVNQTDVIQVYVSNLGILSLTLFGKIRKKEVVYSCRGNFFEEWKKTKNYWLFLKYYLLAKMANKIIFPSKYMQKVISKKFKNKPTEVLYTPNEEKKQIKKSPKSKNKKYTFLQVTSFDYYKKGEGVLLLSKTFKEFSKIYKDSRLIIVGGGKHLEEFKEKVKGKNITFLGRQSKNKVAQQMKDCDCFIHITGLDNLPISILEATSFNKPIIASNKFGIPEISKDLYLTENTVKDILGKMLKVYESGEKKRNYRDIKKFGKNRAVNNFIRYYRETFKP